MGYTTNFNGFIEIEPPLNSQEIKYLKNFSNTRHMDRNFGPYHVDTTGQTHSPDIKDYNNPPKGQPGLWCQWVPTDDGSAIIWNGIEKFYNSQEWLEYLIEHFIGEKPYAKKVDKENFFFLEEHILNGSIKAQGESSDDKWTMYVIENVVSRVNKH